MSRFTTGNPIPASAVDELVRLAAEPGAEFRCFPIDKAAVLCGVSPELLELACDGLVVEHINFHGQRSMTIEQIHQLLQRLTSGDLQGNALAVACRRHLGVVPS
ncbi:hypothetical protein AB0F72_09480 [Actinoplanes sp. NPDC023936]|uniref:hypothetical protein n=1 Tax=Actinoplanes sp. NPDC023936 TaxID=3154910 RepID=UPI00340311D9